MDLGHPLILFQNYSLIFFIITLRRNYSVDNIPHKFYNFHFLWENFITCYHKDSYTNPKQFWNFTQLDKIVEHWIDYGSFGKRFLITLFVFFRNTCRWKNV